MAVATMPMTMRKTPTSKRRMLDSFTDIAEGLYRHLAGRDDPGLRQEVDATIERYFKVEPEASPTREPALRRV